MTIDQTQSLIHPNITELMDYDHSCYNNCLSLDILKTIQQHLNMGLPKVTRTPLTSFGEVG